jgi:hypothetical protein
MKISNKANPVQEEKAVDKTDNRGKEVELTFFP